MDDSIGKAPCLDALAWVAASQEKGAQAVTLLAAADGAWTAIPAGLPPPLRAHHDAALGCAQEGPPGSAYEAFAEGSAMSLAEAIALALGETTRPMSRPDGTRAGALTGR
jgi:hypothetical protein